MGTSFNFIFIQGWENDAQSNQEFSTNGVTQINSHSEAPLMTDQLGKESFKLETFRDDKQLTSKGPMAQLGKLRGAEWHG